MEIISDIAAVRQRMARLRCNKKKIGFVPTMGFLHEGHLSLMRIAKKKSDVLVVSIFVNPSQFAPNEDFNTYPRDLEQDLKLLEDVGCDILFVPTKDLMYPPGYWTWVNVEDMNAKLCGKSRPVFFRGVATIVTKLFNIVQPHISVFGQKDAQQALIIKQMVADLNQDIEIIIGPIVREKDGLAMSSRNAYLSEDERKEALVLHGALQLGRSLIDAGELSKESILNRMRQLIQTKPTAKIDYIEMVDGETLAEIEEPQGLVLLALAMEIGGTRLIDNILIDMRSDKQ